MKTTPKPFKDVKVGQTFYVPQHDKPFVKVSETRAEAITALHLPPLVKQTMDIDLPDHVVQVPGTHRIFNGRDRVEVEECCDGSVKYVTVAESSAHPNAILAPVLVEAVLACKTCGRVLHTIQERPQYHDARAINESSSPAA